jgi:hypothetical protein
MANKGRQTPIEVQAQIIAALLSGQFSNDSDIALEARVSKATVSRIRASLPANILANIITKKEDRMAELVAEFLEEGLESLKRIDGITIDGDWLRTQDAPGLATLYGVKADKVIRILEAVERANSQAESEFLIT